MNQIMEKKKVGRPKGRRRNQYISVPLYIEEKDLLRNASDKLGIGLSAYIRKLVFEKLKG